MVVKFGYQQWIQVFHPVEYDLQQDHPIVLQLWNHIHKLSYIKIDFANSTSFICFISCNNNP